MSRRKWKTRSEWPTHAQEEDQERLKMIRGLGQLLGAPDFRMPRIEEERRKRKKKERRREKMNKKEEGTYGFMGGCLRGAW